MTNAEFIIEQAITDYARELARTRHENMNETYYFDFELIFDRGEIHIARNDRYFPREVEDAVSFFSGDLNEDFWMKKTMRAAAELGKLGGSAKTKAKKQASRENGKLGGRPKKKK